MILVHDWEFLENGSTIAPISVGMVREDGESYYAVFADAPWISVAQHYWLCHNVLPCLSIDGDSGIDFKEDYVKSRVEIAIDVRHFIEGTPDVELWGDYCAYDHVALCQLWGTMMSLPVTVPMFTSDLQTELRRAGLSEEMLPARPASMIEHNALGDARYELLCWKFVREFDAEASYVERKHLLAAAVEGWWKPKGE